MHYLVVDCACVLSHFSCVRLCDAMDHSLAGSLVHGILQARTQEWIVMSSSMAWISWPRNWTHVSYISCVGRLIVYYQSHLGSPVVHSVQFSSVAQSCLTLCDPMDCSTPGFPVSHQLQSLLKLMFIESVMLSNDLVLCHPLLLPSSFFSIRVFSNESVLRIRGPNQLQHQSFQWIFRVDFL